MNERAFTIEIEENENCSGVPERVYEALGEPVRVSRVKAYQPRGPYDWCRVTGWSSEGDGEPVEAYCVKVRDSGAGTAYMVYGGDWGVRLMAGGADERRSLDSQAQWGEPYILLDGLDEVETE